MITLGRRRARSSASALLPLAVGPAISASLGFEDSPVFIATLIAAGKLTDTQLAVAHDKLASAGCAPTDTIWIDEGDAADVPFDTQPEMARAALQDAFGEVDVIVQPLHNREKRLIVSDMDSTMITVECIDELADYAGIKTQIAEVTEQAMRGELDFEAALDARVALLKGLEEGAIDRCLAERVEIMPGAETLIRTMKARGAISILVSGGFTRFAEPVAERIGFDRSVSNVLGIADGQLDGTVARPIVGSARKLEVLEQTMADLGLSALQTMAIGDGANDLPMIEAAGLGVAYKAKPVVAERANAVITHNNLTALLWAQGIPKSEWVLA